MQLIAATAVDPLQLSKRRGTDLLAQGARFRFVAGTSGLLTFDVKRGADEAKRTQTPGNAGKYPRILERSPCFRVPVRFSVFR